MYMEPFEYSRNDNHAADFRVTIVVRNKRLLQAIKRAGFKSAKAFSEACGVSYSTVIRYLNLTLAPIDKSDNWRPSVDKIAATLLVPPNDLFPQNFLNTAFAKNRVTRDVTEFELAGIAADQVSDETPERALMLKREIQTLMGAVSTLTEREQRILANRFGLRGQEPQTFEKIGVMENVTGARVREIEAKALRKLAHPARGLKALTAMLGQK